MVRENSSLCGIFSGTGGDARASPSLRQASLTKQTMAMFDGGGVAVCLRRQLSFRRGRSGRHAVQAAGLSEEAVAEADLEARKE